MFEMFLIAALANYALAYSITHLEGPAGIFFKVREATQQQRNWFERGVWCLMCVSTWTGIVIAVLVFGIAPLTIFYWLAMVGVSIFFTVMTNGRSR